MQAESIEREIGRIQKIVKFHSGITKSGDYLL